MRKVIDISGVIVEDYDPWACFFCGDSAQFAVNEMLRETTTLKAGDEFWYNLYTNGGSIDAGIRFYNECKRLRKLGVKVTAFNVGKQHSIGNVMMLGADTRLAFPSSTGCVHLPRVSPEYFFSMADGVTTEDLEVVISDLDLEEERMLDIYVAETGTAKEALKKIMHEEKTLSAKQLLSLGFLTGLSDTNDFAGGTQPTTDAKQEAMLLNYFVGHNFKFNFKGNRMSKKTFNAKEAAARIIGNAKKALEKLNIVAVNYTFTDADGNTLEVDREDDQVAVGDEATVNGQEDGTFTLEDGRVVTVAAGVVTEIAEPATPPSNEVAALQAENATLQERINALEGTVTDLMGNLNEMGELINQLEGVHTNYTPPTRTNGSRGAGAPPATPTKGKSNAGEASADNTRAARQAFKQSQTY